MKNQSQIKEFIENKEKDSVVGTLNTVTDEFNSMIGREEKETKDSLNILECFKNDKDLYDYAELKLKDDSDLTIKDGFNMVKLELKLSIKCSYFKDFQKFLEELKKGGDVSRNTEENSLITPVSSYHDGSEGKNEQMLREQMKWNPGMVIEGSVLSKWRNNKENIPNEKVQEVWNYVNKGGTFYSPSKGTITWGKNEYKHVCSTGSYNVLWRLGFPRVSNSLNVDLDGSILPKMGLKYMCEVDPDNPEKNGYEPKDGDTAVWPHFQRDSGQYTQHQATYINGHWVSDTIQNEMSCYTDVNEPKNVKIYRYNGNNTIV